MKTLDSVEILDKLHMALNIMEHGPKFSENPNLRTYAFGRRDALIYILGMDPADSDNIVAGFQTLLSLHNAGARIFALRPDLEILGSFCSALHKIMEAPEGDETDEILYSRGIRDAMMDAYGCSDPKEMVLKAAELLAQSEKEGN